MSADAVEIRMLWGETPLWIRHLAPPRTFHLGDAATPLVLVDRTGVSVAVPAGNIPLVRGRRVTIALPSPHAASPYRAAPGGSGARLGLEITLVPAAEELERGWSLGGLGRLLAAVAVTALIVAGLLVHASRGPARLDGARGEEQLAVMQRVYQGFAERDLAEAERERELEQQRLAEQPPDPAALRWAALQEGHWDSMISLLNVYVEPISDGLEQLPLEAMAGLDLTPPALFCDGSTWNLATERAGFLTAHEALCAGALSPQALHALRWAPWLGAVGRADRPSALWFTQLAAARRALRPAGTRAPPRPRVDLDELPPRAWMTADEDAPRALRARLRDVRACYALGLAEEPGLAGWIDLHFFVGSDGAATHPIRLGATIADPRVVSCALRALDGMRLPSPRRHARGFSYRLTLRPAPAR